MTTSTLEKMFSELERKAQRDGKASAMLRGGVKVVVKVSNKSKSIGVWRREKKLSTTEIITFQHHFHLSEGFCRMPEKGQQKVEVTDGTWFGVYWICFYGGGE